MLDQRMIIEIKRNAGIMVGEIRGPVVRLDKNSILWRFRGHSKELEEVSLDDDSLKSSSSMSDSNESSVDADEDRRQRGEHEANESAKEGESARDDGTP